MDRSGGIIASVIGILVIIGLVFLLRQNTPNNTLTYEWEKEYHYQQYQDPFDIDVTVETIKGSTDPGKFKVLPDTGFLGTVLPKGNQSVYFSIVNNYDPSPGEVLALTKFADRGNEVFIYADMFEPFFIKQLLYGGALYVDTNLLDSRIYSFQFKTQVDSFTVLPSVAYEDTLNVVLPLEMNWWDKSLAHFDVDQILSFQMEYESTVEVNFLEFSGDNHPVTMEIPYGDGRFILSTMPIVRTNFFMLSDTFYQHLSGSFAFVEHDSIVFDRFNRFESEPEQERSMFRYLFSQPELKFTFYLLLFSILLFLVFEIKRRQRPIPLIDQNTNKSLQTLRMISRLYSIHPDHRLMALDKLNYFFHFIRKRYKLNTHDIDDEFARDLALNSGVDKHIIDRIIGSYHVIQNQGKTHAQRLMELTNWINTFYKDAK